MEMGLINTLFLVSLWHIFQHQSEQCERKSSLDTTKLIESTDTSGHSTTTAVIPPSNHSIQDTAANLLFTTSMALALKSQRKRKKSSSDSGASSTTDENRPRSRCYRFVILFYLASKPELASKLWFSLLLTSIRPEICFEILFKKRATNYTFNPFQSINAPTSLPKWPEKFPFC